MLIKLLIITSQFFNVLAGGSEDEQLSSRAWRQRKEPGWRELCWLLDNASPLMYWRGSYATHCEACYWEERRRLEDRMKDYV